MLHRTGVEYGSYLNAGSSISYTQRPVCGYGEGDGRTGKVGTHETKLDAALARTFSVTLGEVRTRGEWRGKTCLSFGCVAVETGLGSAVASALAMISVGVKVKIHVGRN